MRIAVCSPDMNERHSLSKLFETALLRYGILPEVLLFPMAQELLSAVGHREIPLDLALTAASVDFTTLRELCRRVPVILIGEKDDGPRAFNVGARYFIENPANTETVTKALSRCFNEKLEDKNV